MSVCVCVHVRFSYVSRLRHALLCALIRGFSAFSHFVARMMNTGGGNTGLRLVSVGLQHVSKHCHRQCKRWVEKVPTRLLPPRPRTCAILPAQLAASASAAQASHEMSGLADQVDEEGPSWDDDGGKRRVSLANQPNQTTCLLISLSQKQGDENHVCVEQQRTAKPRPQRSKAPPASNSLRPAQTRVFMPFAFLLPEYILPKLGRLCNLKR